MHSNPGNFRPLKHTRPIAWQERTPVPPKRCGVNVREATEYLDCRELDEDFEVGGDVEEDSRSSNGSMRRSEVD